jgi:hypothetical protein
MATTTSIILELSSGLGLQSVIGWFVPILAGTTLNLALPTLLALFYYADKSNEFNRQQGRQEQQQVTFDFIIGELTIN